MATPLTDSINALTTYANSVTGETDTTLSDAVYTLASGYGGEGFNFARYAYSCSRLFRNSVFSSDVYLDFTGNTTVDNLNDMFAGAKGFTKITIKGLSLVRKSMSSCFYCYNGSSLQTIEFIDCKIAPTSMGNFCRSNPNLTNIMGEIDLSNATNVSHFFDASENIHEVRFKENSISINLADTASFNRPTAFSDDTLVSIANGLNPNVSGNTIDLHANMVTRCGTLTGINDNGTFVADENGTMSLADFITTVKGWTLA